MNNLEWINGLTAEEWGSWCMAEHDESRSGAAMANRVDYWQKACQTAQRRSAELRAKLSYALDERDRLQEELGARDSAVGALKVAVENDTTLEARVAELSDELANRDKGIERLKRRRDGLIEQIGRLTHDNSALRARIGEVEAERERWRRAFGMLMDGLHELQRYGTLESWERQGSDETVTGAAPAPDDSAAEDALLTLQADGPAAPQSTENM